MNRFSWLHITDIHYGMKDHSYLWPGIKNLFFQDVKDLTRECEGFDLVLLTGDLTFKGQRKEFDLINNFLDQLWDIFSELGFNPRLLAIPGNHDLVRPKENDPLLNLFCDWSKNIENQNEFWKDRDSRYRLLVEEVFKNYTDWWESQKYRQSDIIPGLLPGDFSVSINKGNLSIGVLGLNTSFLQLTSSRYKGRLTIHPLQFHKACSEDGVEWAKDHDVCIFLTHHPPQWLDKYSRDQLYQEIIDHERFIIQLCGHIHGTSYCNIEESGGNARRIWQGKSLFGLQNYGKRLKSKRLHGYSAATIEFKENVGSLIFFPREARLQGSQREIVPDLNFRLINSIHTKPIIFSSKKLKSDDHYKTVKSECSNNTSAIKNDKRKTNIIKKPNNLPPRIGELIGRIKEKKNVIDGILSRWPIVSIEGMGGIGKTTLAQWVAFDCLSDTIENIDKSFEACAFISAKDKEIFLNDLLDTISRVLGKERLIERALSKDKLLILDKMLRKYSVLVIVDNFETVTDRELINFLQQIPEPSKVLLTSRYGQFRKAYDVQLKGLETDESLELIRCHAKRLGLDIIECAKDTELMPLVDVTGGNPYAIETSLGYIKYSGKALNEMVNDLFSVEQSVENIFDHIFSEAWRILSPDARNLLLVMPFYVNVANQSSINQTTGIVNYYFDKAITQLIEMSLIEVTDVIKENDKRYSIHPLTKAFLKSKIKNDDRYIIESRNRWIKWYSDFLNLYKEDIGERYSEVENELENCIAVIDWCLNNARQIDAIDLFQLLISFLIDKVHWYKAIEYGEKIAKVCQKLKLFSRSARILCDSVGYIYCRQNDLLTAEKIAKESIRILDDYPDQENRIVALRLLGVVARMKGNLVESEKLLREALRIAADTNNQQWKQIILGILAGVLRRQDKFDEAEKILLHEYKDSENDSVRRAIVSGRLGTHYYAIGNYANAKKYYAESVKMDRKLERDLSIAWNLYKMAKVEIELNSKKVAKKYAEEALWIFKKLDIEKQIDEVNHLIKGLDGEKEK